jgi:hypothetical protein
LYINLQSFSYSDLGRVAGLTEMFSRILISASLALLVGCAGTGGGLGSVEKTKQLSPGMKMAEVRSLLGEPSQTQFVSDKLVWKYSLHEYWKGFVPYYLEFGRKSMALERWFADENEYMRQQQLWLQAIPLEKPSQGQSSSKSDCESKYPLWEDRMCNCHGYCGGGW